MANATQEDIARHQRRQAAADAARTVYLANKAANPKKFDDAGLRDISAASIWAASEIRRLSAGRD